MCNKIESRLDFKEKIENNPFELLQAIKKHSLNYQEKKYSMSVILDSLKTLLATRQKEGESLQDFTKRFRVTQEVLESHLGDPIILTKFLQATLGYTEEPTDEVEKQKNKILEDQAFEQLLAYMYLENADQTKYGSILSGLSTQQSLGNDQYPKMITEANNVLSNHRFDFSKRENFKNYTKIPTKVARRDQDQDKINLSFAQMEGKCYCCGKPGHKSPQCRFKDKPKHEWAINKVQQSHAQANKSSGKANQESTNQVIKTPNNSQEQDNKQGWTGVRHLLFQGEDMKDWILLDNESTTPIFCNPDMVRDIRETKNGSLNHVTNAGVLQTTQKATIPGWGEAWFNPNVITNIFSYAEMAKKHWITYDLDKEGAFIIYLPDKKVKFSKTDQGLYVFKP